MDIDWRVVVVFLPIIVAGGWAAYNVLQLAIQQIQNFLNKEA